MPRYPLYFLCSQLPNPSQGFRHKTSSSPLSSLLQMQIRHKYMPGRIAESKKLFSVLAKKRPRSTSTFAPFRRQTTIVNKDEIQSHLYTSVFCTCSRTDIMVLPSLPKNVRGKCAEVAAKLGAGKVKWHVLLFTGNNGKWKDFPLWQTDGIGMERKKREKR